MLESHVPSIRARYKVQRDAMQASLERHLGGMARWVKPVGGMFFWLELREGLDAVALLPKAVDAGMAYVPGAAFYAQLPRANTLRLSFVTASPEKIEQGVAALAGVLKAVQP
jgi:2-aminoadipate transaminase